MKQFIHKVQGLGQKAAEFKKMIEGAPAKAAELRQAVTMTAGELNQLRTDVQSSLAGLQASSEERLITAMHEINDAALVFEEAGYELTGMDLDFALNQRLTAHLLRFQAVESNVLKSLQAKETRSTVKAILSGLLKAEETAANVELGYLQFHGVVVHVGVMPAIRILWRSDTMDEQQAVGATGTGASTSPSAAVVSQSGSFFEPRPIPGLKTTVASTESAILPKASAVPIEPSSTVQSAHGATSPWGRGALDRFKRMPDLSKHRR